MSASDDIISAEVVEDWAEAKNRRSALEFFQSTTAMAIVLVVLFISSSLLYFMLDDDPVDYGASMVFEQDRARGYAEDLVNLGHPDWKGRMSGSAEEQAAAEYIANTFEELGYQSTLHTYEVPMHSINSEPSLRVCVPGAVGGIGVVPCSTADVGQQITSFNHRIDYVIQGFSGESSIMFGQDMEVVHLGNGSDDALWSSAAGKVGYIEGGGTKTGNTFIMTSAIEYGLDAIIRVNKDYNCGKIEGNDCVPIFKGTGYDAIVEANGGSAPSQLAFIAMSKDAGEILESVVINGSGRLEMIIDVTNNQELTIRVPCGTYYGTSDELLIVGGHHDTVYHGPGAIDDTSGTASVLEMATMFSEYIIENGEPERTLRFCTWGGEEEGLWGSTAYVDEMNQDLAMNLRLYVNLDMNHVDIDQSRSDSVTLFANHPEDYGHIERLAEEYKVANPQMASKYTINLGLYDGAKGDSDGMPCNSDHCPFVYDLDGGDTVGRAAVCYGSGSWEYHTYLDDLTRFNEESLGISVTIYGNYVKYLAWNLDA
ncbi:MAG: M20/M25/M40 family metallo-hydrolase [Euryarchaeota archaeon]|jgi:hypothetical protein|nr:M20/M25/M40 family metallo-hydrolase [Euryarchaeota archaeon]MBT4982307.1 M20/M25/M40 family metallo-hydrolase [Euryarchaeota archaeon]MBT5184398.1 M20/M25/M40 family metallo-hydrolase [Euryarchaeota archaeon]